MSQSKFHARSAAFEIVKEYALMLRFIGRGEDGESEMLTLQRALDSQDDKPGIDGVCLERGVQQSVSFGGVQECTLTTDGVSIVLDAEGAMEMGGIRNWFFGLSFSGDQKKELKDALTFIFRNCDCFEER